MVHAIRTTQKGQKMFEKLFESTPCPKIKDTKIGDILTVTEEYEGEKRDVKYKVTEVHPFIVRAVRNRGKICRCFCYGDLVMMGKEGRGYEKNRYQ